MKMIHDNEYMRKDDARDKIRAAIEALAAPAAPRAGREMMPTIETRAGVPVLVMSTGARPATDAEVAFFAEAERLRAYIANLAAAPAAPQQAEPAAQIGWADEFGNLFPMGAWKPAQRTHHDSHKTAWRPVFLHPPAAEVRLQGGLDNEELLEAWRTKVPGVEPTDSDLRAFALGVEFGTRGKRVYFDERNSARDAWRRRVKQCETLEAEVQKLRDAASALCGALTASELNDRAYHALNALHRALGG